MVMGQVRILPRFTVQNARNRVGAPAPQSRDRPAHVAARMAFDGRDSGMICNPSGDTITPIRPNNCLLICRSTCANYFYMFWRRAR